ncbi:uncharacterized protein LOC132599411 isoform X2 [Lycium barbarum]|uniref:uncharacterized protein LOC132599411 isoform X2 n=1 Tax=Lycium barbarum TaxID=112863 RepID=UPI00293F2427|nr:uncharacterized protein LOC132599411 isoform X2 [Lycium barbarum]
MDKMAKLGKPKIMEDFMHYQSFTFCRAYFKFHSKCDVVENNICETLNSWILAARHKSIITILEEIRHNMMNRHVDMIKFAETWIDDIAPMTRRILEENKELSNRCHVQWNGVHGFEIRDGGFTFVVHLDKKYCDCRLWMLGGIPCPHVVCAYYYLNLDLDAHVEHWYRKETFLKAYSHFIQPITNTRMWPKTINPSIEPPVPRKMPGRPKKKRMKDKDKPKKYGKLSKKGVKMPCSLCKQVGHNKTACGRGHGIGDPCQPIPSTERQKSQSQPTPPTQSSSICSDTSSVPKDAQTVAPTPAII